MSHQLLWNERRFEFFKTLFKYKFEIACQIVSKKKKFCLSNNIIEQKASDFVFNYPSTIFIIYFIGSCNQSTKRLRYQFSIMRNC